MADAKNAKTWSSTSLGTRLGLAGAAAMLGMGVLDSIVDRLVPEPWADRLLMVLYVAGAGATFFLMRWVTSRRAGRLRQIASAAADFARTGELKALDFQGGADLVELESSVSSLARKLRELLGALSTSARLMSDAGVDLTQAAKVQHDTVARQAVSVEQLRVTTEEIRRSSELALSRVQEVLVRADRSESLGRLGDEAIGKSLAGLAEFRAHVEEIGRRINALEDLTSQVGEVTRAVEVVAERSNVLALNAAIEAATAGDRGRGFQVVAQEIRALADESLQSTARVRLLLDGIRDAAITAAGISRAGSSKIQHGLEQMRASADTMAELTAIGRDTLAAAKDIANAVAQQNSGINQVVSATRDLAGATEQTVASAEQAHQSAVVITTLSEGVAEVIKQYKL
ncbi:MAG TPA: methyl-accepting chemotaxis protein [Myxococcaceae bacterium]|nr:methyl-accepting chemotaxis protein [Myxococcaceae bacterium]